jgi:hypothetical protein
MSGHSQAGPPADPAAADPAAAEPRHHLSRRSMLRGTGASAAGLAALAVAGPAVPAAAAAKRPAAPAASRSMAADGGSERLSQPVVVQLRDVQSGELDVFAGTSHTRLRDPDLAARLARAAR